ncbi:YSIRK-type signal peptide-containing protein [Lactobacillus reuteri]|uniref:YSIRK-type signal peptide-containing protein n=1 Tax=Limosilactobacillus reuteri TaxID=1598 RepID=A0A6L5P5F4_LIMRT|nr:YSIRK-type signal peptide-containing protein [Limosilactobacillus reuteri]MRH09584.1 YSIRK-type signal peptide-containing protein [Limosilactobacillus reuteri]
MTAKNNQVERLTKNMPITQRFALRKLSVGVVSVLLGTSIALGLNGETAQADTSANRITPQPAAAQTTLPAVVSTNDSQSNINTTTSTSKELAPTTPVDETAYTVTNVKAASEQGNGTDHTGRTNLTFDLDLDIANHEIKSGNYINVSMGIPYQLTANDQQHILSYGGGASQTMPININYQATSGESYSTVIGYMRPVAANNRSYAISSPNSQVVKDLQDVTWEASQNNNTLGSNGNGGSNDSYQIIFNDELENIKTKYGKNNLSLARLHFNLTWHNITGFNLDEAPLDTRYFHLYSSTATAPTMLVPQNDIQIGNRRFTSGFKIPVEAQVRPADNFNQTIIPQSSSEYAVHTWYYNQQTKTWSIGDEAVRYPDHEETVALAAQSESGVKLGKHFTITVTKPADNDQVDYQFISATGVKNALEKSIVSHYKDYDLDPVIDSSNTYVTRKMISTTAPAITVKSTDSSDGLTRTYDVIVASDYVGFRKDTGIGLINWRPKNLSGVLPPANIKDPNADQIFIKGYYQGVALKDTALQNYLEQHPWKLTVTNEQGQELVNQEAGYYLQPYVYRNDTTSNSGILTGKVNNVENRQVKETIHYFYKDTGKEAVPTYTTKLGFARINDDGQWLAWTPANDTFAAVDVPVIPGYHAVDEGGNPVKAIAAITVKHDSPDVDITVYYVADPQVLTYTVIDKDTQKVLENQVPLANGLSDEPLPTDTAAKYQQVIQGYQDKGYYLVSADKLPAAFDDNPNVNQNVTIYVAKRNQLHSEERTVMRTITYYDRATDKQIMIEGVTEPVIQQAIFARQAIVAGPHHQIIGYTLNQQRDQNGNYLVEVSLANADQAWKLERGGWPASPNPDLQKYGYAAPKDMKGNLYPVVASGQPTALMPSESVKVYYQPRLTSKEEQVQSLRTIHYVYANGPRKGETAAPDVQQVVTFARLLTTNEVTKEVNRGEWQVLQSETIKDGQAVIESDPTSFATVASPSIKGYTPDQTVVANELASQGEQPIEVTVSYTTEPHEITYSVIDDATGLTLINHTRLGSGYADEQIPLAMREDYQNVSAHYEQLGYKLVSQETLPATFADHDLNVVVHLTHGTEKVTKQRIINEDIRYEFVEGGIAAPSYQAAPIVFTRHGLADQVTGKTSWESWEPVSDHFTPVVSPLVAGYTPSNQQIDEQYVTVESQDLHFIVLYSKNPVKPHPTPDEPDEPVTPVNPEKPASSSSAGSTPAQPDEPSQSDTPSSSGSASTHPSETPKSDGPTSSAADVPVSSAVPNSAEPVVPETPATPTSTATGINLTPVKAVSAASESSVNEMLVSAPVTVHAVKGDVTPTIGKNISSTVSQKLPQTGNQHQSIWRVILGAFLGLFGISLGKRRKKNS